MQLNFMKTHNHEPNQWMLIAVLLGVLLVFSVATNYFVYASLVKDAPAGGFAGNGAAPLPSAGNSKVNLNGVNIQGNTKAKVTLIEYSDYQCPYCANAHPIVLALQQKYGSKINFAHKHFPLSFHPYAVPAALAAECAGEQGKYFEYHNILFDSQDKLGTDSVQYLVWAKDLGLDTEKFSSCLSSGKYLQKIQKEQQEGLADGVSGTPTFFIGSQKIVGAQSIDAFSQIIDKALQE